MFDRRTDERIEAHVYLISPATINTTEKLCYYDNVAVRGIAEAESIITALKAYRQSLYERMQELETTPFKRVLSIVRERRGYNPTKIFYYVSIERVYDGGIARNEEFRETFPGSERYKALKRFAELQKQNPGIEAIKDIEKAAWER